MNLKINFFLGTSVGNIYQTYGIPFLQNSTCSQFSTIRTSGRILFLSSDNKLIDIIDNNNINVSKIIYYPYYGPFSKIFYSFSISKASFFTKENFTKNILTIKCNNLNELDSLEIKSVFINDDVVLDPHFETDKSKIFETLIHSMNLKQNASKEISFYGDINCFLSLQKSSAKQSSININTLFQKLKENMKIIQ